MRAVQFSKCRLLLSSDQHVFNGMDLKRFRNVDVHHIPWAPGGKIREFVFNGDRAAIWDDEKVLQMDGGDGSTTGWMNLMPLKNAT